MKASLVTFALSALASAEAVRAPREARDTVLRSMRGEKAKYFSKRQAPDGIPSLQLNYTTIQSPSGVPIRYKEPGKAGVCETTPGVNSYSGYIDLTPDLHAFFWFFESRGDPSKDPVTLWLNGGPGSDSQIGLFQELGPCMVNEQIESVINPYSWTNASNFIFLSQPFGTGFSYSEQAIGSLNNVSGAYQNTSAGPADGRYPIIDPESIDTTYQAAVAGWEIIQAFYSNLPQLAPNVTSKTFNLWTESYGGHYGPAFYRYFQQQNDKLDAASSENGIKLNMNSLGIGNGIINERIQGPYYPEFAVNNTYGIKAYNDTVYNYAKFAYYMKNGCRDQIDLCESADQSTPSGKAICTEAADMCRDNVESPYYFYGGRGVYDIRHPYNDTTPPSYFEDYLNKASVQQAIGVSLNYTTANEDIYWAFQQTGDFVYNSLLTDLEQILDSGVSVTLFYGDADYICNWFGGEAVSMQVNYTHADQFRRSGYVPFTYNGQEYGETRQAGNFSFTRIYEAGHEVPFYQPEAAYALFSRAINLKNIADGSSTVTTDYSTQGNATATHTEPFVALPSSTASYGSSSVPSASPTGKAGRLIGGRY